MEQWYTLHTKPNAESQVEVVLRERGVHTYLPQIESRKVNGRRKQEPFFPCYLFIKIDLEAVGLSYVQWTPGLRRIVAFDDRPVPLPEEVIVALQRKLNGLSAAGNWPAHTFKPGDTVRIIDGPLQGMLAKFEGPTSAAERVDVLLTILGHVSRARVPVAELEKAGSDVEVPAPKRPRRTRGRSRRVKSSRLAACKH